MGEVESRHWLLLRGLGRESAHWGSFVPQLQAAFPGDRITTLDLPGSGRFVAQDSPNRIDAITEVVRQQALDDGLLQKPVTLLGLSLGGMVAWHWLKQFPGDVRRGVLVNSSFASLSPFYQRLRWQAYGEFFPLLTHSKNADLELRVVRLVSNQPDANRRFIAERWTEIRRQRPMRLTNVLRQIQAAACFRPDQQRPSQPLLLLGSAGDRLVDPACSRAISHHYQIPLYSHPSAGHDLPLDDGQWLIQQLHDWLLD